VRVRDEFLGILAHELRNPLNVIQGWVQILKSEKLDEAGTKQAIDMLERNSQLQAHLINDLLDVSRIRCGKLSMETRPTDLVKVLTSSAESIRLSAQKKNIQLNTSIESQQKMVPGDFSHLHRMVLNLLSNAVKFTPSGGRVDLELKTLDNQAIILVRDTGKGISAEFIPYVFESFRQEDSATTRLHGGLGLGLAITKHIVEQHGGSITVTSAGIGKGAEIKVLLPLLPEVNCIGEMPREQSPPVVSHKGVLHGVRVLLVDDAEDMRFLLTHYLQRSGADVIVAASPGQALQEIGQVIPDILLSDIGMPEEDGYSLITKLRQLPATQGGRVVAIALTAYAREEEKQKAITAGFNAHLAKPIFAPALVEKICDLLQLEKRPL